MKNHTDVLIFHTVMADEKSPARISHRRFAASCLEGEGYENEFTE